MTLPLPDRIGFVLAGTGRPQTAREIAKQLRVRLSDVLLVLRSDDRFCQWPHPRRKLYSLHGEKVASAETLRAREQTGTEVAA